MLRLKSPLSVQLELTDACNNACIHCYNYWRYLETGSKLNKDNLKRTTQHFISIFEILKKCEIRVLILTGGEPFLRRDVLFEIAKLGKKAGMIIGVNTNGTLISPDDADTIYNLGIDFVLISLLGKKPKTHNLITNSRSFSRTIGAIKLLAQRGVNVSVNTVVSKLNFDEIREVAELISGLGVKSFSATPVIACYLAQQHQDILLTPSQIKEVLEILLSIQKDLGLSVDVLEPLVHCMFTADEQLRYGQFLDHRSCSAGITEAAISPNGDVRPCIHTDQIVGNVLKDGWEACWHRLENWTSPDLLPKDCLTCQVVDFCGGGCRMAALDKTSNISGKDPYMSKPLADSHLLSITQAKQIDFKNTDKFRKTKGFILREENFGGIVFSNKRYIFLNKEPFLFLKEISKSKSFSIDKLVSKYQVDYNELKEFIRILLARGFLEPAERSRRL
jgi:radical SAM protein with 4Fe4S-binding SPASM domain